MDFFSPFYHLPDEKVTAHMVHGELCAKGFKYLSEPVAATTPQKTQKDTRKDIKLPSIIVYRYLATIFVRHMFMLCFWELSHLFPISVL